MFSYHGGEKAFPQCVFLILLLLLFAAQSAVAQTKVYYTHKSGGSWHDADTWTESLSGAELVPSSGMGVPGAGAKVVILPTSTPIRVEQDIVVNGMEIEIRPGARLDMGGHTFNGKLQSISGGGTLVLGSAQLPEFRAGGSFPLCEAGGGTLELRASAGSEIEFATFPSTVNHLTLTGGATYSFAHEAMFTVYGDLRVEAGATFIFGGNGPTRRQRMAVHGDIAVSSRGIFKVADWRNISAQGEAGPGLHADYAYYQDRAHCIYLHGNLRSEGGGRIALTPSEKLDFSQFTNQSCAALFLVGDRNAQITANSQVDLYFLVLDKELGQQNRVRINASERSFFRLFGPNATVGVTAGPNPLQQKALWIRRGNLTLGANTVVASLSEGGDPFIIPADGALVLDGDNVLVVGKAASAEQVQELWKLLSLPKGVGSPTTNATKLPWPAVCAWGAACSVWEKGQGLLPTEGWRGA